MTIPRSRDYIASNPQFAMTSAARPPQLHRGQMTILYGCLEPYPQAYSLEELAHRCDRQGYRLTFKNRNTEIRLSILYQLNRLLEGTEKVSPNSIRIVED
jgi:hypothetical protein